MFIDPVLYTAAPDGGREDVEMRCYALLDSLGIAYRRCDHDRADTIEACEEVEKILGITICKNLFLTNRQQTEFYLLLMPGQKPFETKIFSKLIGTARLSFASPEHMVELLGLQPGSVSILGLMNDKEKRVHLYIDTDVFAEENFGCHPCKNTTSLGMSTADVREKLIPALGHEAGFVELPWNVEEV